MKIAAFDSGIGGLIALAPLIQKNANLEITYLGDLANLPYGTKSPNRIQDLTHQNLEGLLNFEKKHFDLLVLACNTASAYAFDSANSLGKKSNTQVLGVIDPACQWAMQSILKTDTSGRVIVLGTTATVRSQVYIKNLRNLGYTGEILQVAAPLFVPLVESEFENTPAAEFACDYYLKGIIQKNDIVILGCTHYPILKHTLQKIFPEVALWLEAGEALLKNQFIQSEIRTVGGPTKLKILLTDSTVDQNSISRLFKKLHIQDKVDWELVHIPPFA